MLSRVIVSMMRARTRAFFHPEGLLKAWKSNTEQQICFAGVGQQEEVEEVPSLSDILSEGLWLAVPKSKISRSRKRMKWKQHIPKEVAWAPCPSCGEPKRPHRLCGTCLSKKLHLEKHGEGE